MSARFTRTLLVLTALATASVACTQSTEEPSPNETTSAAEAEIVGGRTTTANPAIGAFVDASGPFCTGTLVTKRVIVTAAHCFEDARAEFREFIEEEDAAMSKGDFTGLGNVSAANESRV